jgi:hypothetical protein
MDGRAGSIWVRGLFVVILLFVAGTLLLSAFLPAGEQTSAIGLSGIMNIIDIRESGNVGEEPGGTSGDNELDIVAVPIIYNETNEEGRHSRNNFSKFVDHLKTNLSQKTPFRRADDPRSHVDIVELETGEVTNPAFSQSGSVQTTEGTTINYANVTCDDVHSAALTAASSYSYDRVVAYVNGTRSSNGRPVTMQNVGVVGCSDAIGGEVAAYEHSIFNHQQTTGVLLHELGHTFGLCHNAGVDDINRNCDLTEVPARGDMCPNTNTSDGPDAIMNYCFPLSEFSGSTVSREDEYEILEQVFADAGWLYAN